MKIKVIIMLFVTLATCVSGTTNDLTEIYRFNMASESNLESACYLVDISKDFDRVSRSNVYGPARTNNIVALPTATVTVESPKVR